MTFDDYIDQVKSDAIEYMRENVDLYDSFDDLMDELFVEDSVTGNGSGSYTFSSAKAAEFIVPAMFDERFCDDDLMCDGGFADIVKRGSESIDVSLRCVALGYASYDIECEFDTLKDAD